MQLQMQSQRYDRQQHQRTERSPERTPLNTDYRFDFATEIQPRYQHQQQNQHQFQNPSQNQQHQQRARDRDDMSKAGARRMSINGGNTNGYNVNDSIRTRDDGCQLHSPPSSPRLLPTSTSANTITRTTAPRNGRAEHRLTLPISGRLLRSDWVNLEGLIQCALGCLGKEECTGISELGTFHFLHLRNIPFLLAISARFILPDHIFCEVRDVLNRALFASRLWFSCHHNQLRGWKGARCTGVGWGGVWGNVSDIDLQ